MASLIIPEKSFSSRTSSIFSVIPPVLVTFSLKDINVSVDSEDNSNDPKNSSDTRLLAIYRKFLAHIILSEEYLPVQIEH